MICTIEIEDAPSAENPNKVTVRVEFDPPLDVEAKATPAFRVAMGMLEGIQERETVLSVRSE